MESASLEHKLKSYIDFTVFVEQKTNGQVIHNRLMAMITFLNLFYEFQINVHSINI